MPPARAGFPSTRHELPGSYAPRREQASQALDTSSRAAMPPARAGYPSTRHEYPGSSALEPDH